MSFVNRKDYLPSGTYTTIIKTGVMTGASSDPHAEEQEML
jgi:hypothetical protein